MVRFLLNTTPLTVSTENANQTVLHFLREQRRLTGTKEGCASGDCGACTVVVAELNPSHTGLHYRTINSCIALMSSLHGKQLITVEHLAEAQQLHPVQQALVDHHASQCGFCTPGFVMSIFALYQRHQPVNRSEVEHALSGNLCRCTGYRPIIDATMAVCQQPVEDKFNRMAATTIATLTAMQANTSDDNQSTGLLMPTSREALAACIAQHPEALLVAGSTDLSLEITQQLRQFKTLISISQLAELHSVECDDDYLTLGAACTLSDIKEVLLDAFAPLTELFERFASLPVRNQATLGGNLANASPIGDMAPVMLALEADFIADDGQQTYTLPARTFFTGYRQTSLPAGAWLSKIRIPRLATADRLAAYKVSKRFEDDISAVCAVFKLRLDSQGKITRATTGFGGVAATPASAIALEQNLVGMALNAPATLVRGKQILATSFAPIDDVRASADYRNQLVVNLWHRFFVEQQPSTNRISTRVQYHA